MGFGEESWTTSRTTTRCVREQRFVLDAFRAHRDLSAHMADAVLSRAIVLAADRSIREQRVVDVAELG